MVLVLSPSYLMLTYLPEAYQQQRWKNKKCKPMSHNLGDSREVAVEGRGEASGLRVAVATMSSLLDHDSYAAVATTLLRLPLLMTKLRIINETDANGEGVVGEVAVEITMTPKA